MKYIVSIGGGINSTLILPVKLIEGMKIPLSDLDFVTCHLPNEDQDVFRLIESVEKLLGITVKKIGHNKTPFDVFFESKFLGNSRIDPCSRILKREVMRNYVTSNYGTNQTVICVGIGHHEIDREYSIRMNWKKHGYKVLFPLDNLSKLNRQKQIDLCLRWAGFVPKLYLMGFSHNNCGGACIKAGKKEWARLWFFLPETYRQWENNENKFRSLYGDYSILREVINGEKTNLTLAEFRLRLESLAITKSKRELNYIDQFNQISYFKTLDETPGCSFCDSAGFSTPAHLF